MRTKFFYFVALAAFALVSCNNDEPTPTVDRLADTEISINAAVAELTPQNAPRRAPQAEYPTGALTAGTLGFYMQTAGTEGLDATLKAKYNGANKKIEYIGEQWVFDGEPLLWRNYTDQVTWQAYYPYTESNVVDGILRVVIPTDQDMDGAYDLLYAQGTTSGMESINGIDITFSHVMSKLTVNLHVGTEFDPAPEFTSVKLKGLHNTCAFDVTNGTWGTLDAAATLADVAMQKNQNTEFVGIVIPQTIADFVVEITTADARVFRFTQQNVQLHSGLAYTLSLRVGKDKVELAEDGITVGDWETPDNWNGQFETE